MSATAWIVLAVIVVAVIVVAAIVMSTLRARRRRQLRDRFGPEYDRTVDTTGSELKAAKDLKERADRRDELDLHDIPPQRREVFQGEWSGVQASFVDDPSDAVSNAARLVHDAMTERGYPDDGSASQIDMVSVDHPDLVQKFRSAHETSVRGRSGDADTEELRVAMLRYRAVFDRMLTPEQTDSGPRSESRR
jgi:hypothetical protein